MRANLRVLMVAGFLMGVGSLSLQANLLTNGSFESPVVPTGSFTDFASGSTGITGWTVVGAAGGVAVINGTFAQECCTFPAADGTQWVDVTGLNTNSAEGVQQTVATTLGTQYTLSFEIGNIFDPSGIFGTTSTVKVFLGGIGGSLIDTATNSSTTTGTQTWQQFTTSFTASGASTTLAFINSDPGNDNSNGLDNVILTANAVTSGVPEPVTLVLIGAGILGLGLLGRRKIG
jgi:hypothetical protein